jgi:hypothetical protein
MHRRSQPPSLLLAHHRSSAPLRSFPRSCSSSRRLAHRLSLATPRRDSSARRRLHRSTSPLASSGPKTVLVIGVDSPLPTPKGRTRFLVSSHESGRDVSRDSRDPRTIENDDLRATRFAFSAPQKGSTATCPPMGFCSPSTCPTECSDLHRNCLIRLCSAFRFSRPLDALLRSRSLGLVSCRIRPWGSCSQRFPPPGSRHGFFFTAPAPVRDHHLADSPSLQCRSTTSTANRLDGSSTRDSCIRKIRSRRDGFTRDPSVGPLAAFVAPPRISPLESRRRFLDIDSHGLSTALDFSITAAALQSFKELEGRLASFENCIPPWGFLF